MLAQTNKYQRIQQIANEILMAISSKIVVGKTEPELVNDCLQLIDQYGIDEFWYHNTPVIIAIGKDTLLSFSGKDYSPKENIIQLHDLVTIDLSIALDNHWGVRAQSFFIENNAIQISNPKNLEFKNLKEITQDLHDFLIDIARPNMTYHDLYEAINKKVKSMEVCHLDFRGNFGHSIEKNLSDRLYIMPNNHITIGNETLFSFEPHICLMNGKWGFKDADIYYFNNHRACKVY